VSVPVSLGAPVPRQADDYSRAAAASRMEFIQVVTGTRSEHIGRYTPSTRRAWPAAGSVTWLQNRP
jgi:hypothetical protein